MESRTESAVSTTLAPITFQPGPQERFLQSKANIVIFGGGAGGGKSYALLLEMLRHYNNAKFNGIIFRRNSVQIRNPGGLWDTSMELYSRVHGTPRQAFLEWKFPSGSTIKMAHLEHKDSVYSYQGSQIPTVMWDELTHFEESQFFYMMSRLRSVSGVPGYMRATCNPEPGWVKDLIQWFIGEDGFPIKERCGLLRWFIRRNDAIIWGDSKEELWDAYGIDELPKSLTFIPSLVHDNKILLEKDPSYLSNLKALSRVDRMRLLEGNWNVKEAAGNFFRQEWFPVVEAVPGGWIQSVRFWDRACLIGGTKIITSKGDKEIRNIQVGDFVLTRKGFKRVTWSGISKTTNKIISVVFSNGAVICGTNCHPAYTENRGWVSLSKLKASDRVLWKKLSSTAKDTSSLMDENITFITKNISTIMNGEELPGNTNSDCSIEMSGNFITGPFPMVTLSTMRMGTELITELKILDAFLENGMGKSINQTWPKKLTSKIMIIEQEHMRLFQLEHSNQKNINVSIVEQLFMPKVSKLNIVNRIVNLFDVPVYDLTVTECPEFFANGILVHNSTKPSETNKDPDWTRGLKLFKYPDGRFCVADLRSIRDTPLQVEKMIRNVAGFDGQTVEIISQQDPGSAGVSESDHFIRMLSGYNVRTEVLSKDKITRAKPVSAQCEAGNIMVLKAPWNNEFFNELENFPDAVHDDCVDVLSGSFNAMSHGLSTADVLWRGSPY